MHRSAFKTLDLETCHQIIKKPGGLELLKLIASNDPPEDHPQHPHPLNQPDGVQYMWELPTYTVCPCPQRIYVAENVPV